MRYATLPILILLGLTCPGAAGRTPNVIIFYADDMGCGDLGCYGATDIRTPHIDSLARSGIRLTSYYAPAPICAPSRAGLLTGRYPTRAGMSSHRNVPSMMDVPGMPGREITIAELAREKGYATAVFGKWHLGSTFDTQPNAQGFDLFLGHHASCIDSYSHMYYASEPWYHDLYRNREEIFEDGVHMTDLITRETLRFIDEHRDGRFLIYAAYNTPHYPMVSPGRFMKQYAHLPRPRQCWAALASCLDESVGRIMNRIEERGLTNDTLVFFASDNGAPNASLRGEGGGSNAPYREYKRSLFDGGIRVPGIVSWPGTIPAAETRDQPAIGMDIFATIADAIQAPLPKDRVIDGRSWLAFLKDPARPGQERLFFEWDGQLAVREGRWKLVENGLIDMEKSRSNRATGPDQVFLADVQEDPSERVNVRSRHPDIADRLLRLAHDWQASVASDPTASTPPPDQRE